MKDGDLPRPEPLVVGLLGLGTVGTGVARILADSRERIARRAGRPILLKWAVVRDAGKPREAGLASGHVVGDARRLLDDPEVHVVIEAMGGTEPALTYVRRALESGKDVVTANKALLADHGGAVFSAARAAGRCVAFEASVGGGIPIVHILGEALAANEILGISAIVNGTCNFILTAMTRDGLPYETALKQAQALGYAEADPTLDVDGTDTAHKLAILAQLAFGEDVRPGEIPRSGIDRLQLADIRYASELGYVVKLLALAHPSASGLILRVAPCLVKRGTPLAEVAGPYNAIRVVGDAVGDTLFYGRGAGMMPTASAIVADLIDLATGRARETFRTLDLWAEPPRPVRLAAAEEIRSRYYLRFAVADQPGVIGTIAQILGHQGISIASIIQHDPGDDAPDATVPLVIMSHMAAEARVRRALAEIDRLDVVRSPSVCLGVED